jgi:hypothetical protein
MTPQNGDSTAMSSTANLEVSLDNVPDFPGASSNFLIVIANWEAQEALTQIAVVGTTATFEGIPLGTYEVFAIREGENSEREPVTINVDVAGKTFSHVVELDKFTPIGKITAIVLVNEKPVKGKTVLVVGVEEGNTTNLSDTTNDDGVAEFPGLEKGTYRVTAKCPPWVDQEQECELTPGNDEATPKFKFND